MKKIFKIALALLMAFGIQIATLGSVSAETTSNLPDSKYTVPTTLMNASNIANASMAGGALAANGELVVEDGEWYLIAEFQTLDFGGAGTIFGNASDIKYYEGNIATEKHDAEIISYRNNATVTTNDGTLENQTAVEKVKIPVAVNSKGIYISLFVDFMNYAPDAYISFNTESAVKEALNASIKSAKALVASDYTTESYQALQTAIKDAEAALNGNEAEMANQITELQTAMNALVGVYNLADGTYSVAADVLKTTSDESSMAASAIKSATVTAKDRKLLVTLEVGAVTVYGQTAYIDAMEYEDTTTRAADNYKKADITGYDANGNVSELQFTLPKNTKITNIKFYYGGSINGSAARLSLGLDNPTKVTTSKFTENGTYTVDIALWNATQDQTSMAASAIENIATVVVKDGVATMYVTAKEMTMGTIKAWLQELYIGSSNSDYKANPATIINKDADGNPTLWSFELPNEEELFDVVVNPHVAMMGNADIPARIKVDYTTLVKVSDSTEAPKGDITDNGTSTTPSTTPTTNPTTGTTGSLIKTGDDINMGLMGGLLISSLAIAAYLTRKKLCK